MAQATPLITSLVETDGSGSQYTAQYTGNTYNNRGGLGTVTVGLFDEDVHSYTDRGYEWNGVTTGGLPAYLVGGEYVVTANESRDNNAYSLTLTLAQPVFVYLLIDNRGSVGDGNSNNPPNIGTGTNQLGLPFMQWVLASGFTPIKTGVNRTGSILLPDEVGQDAGATQGVGAGISIEGFESVYGKRVEAGTLVLGEQSSGFNVGRDMYGVVVKAVPEPASAALAGLGLLTVGGRRLRARHRNDGGRSRSAVA